MDKENEKETLVRDCRMIIGVHWYILAHQSGELGNTGLAKSAAFHSTRYSSRPHFILTSLT